MRWGTVRSSGTVRSRESEPWPPRAKSAPHQRACAKRPSRKKGSIMNKITFCTGALAVCCSLLGGCIPAFGQHAPGGADSKAPINEPSFVIRNRTELVNLTVSVTDRSGRAITGLAPEDFVVYEDKVKQKIEHYAAE